MNVTYGHDCGDYALREVAKLVAEHFKDYIAARFGGEEFCIFMPNQNFNQALIVLEDFRLTLANKTFTFDGNRFNCNVSIGLTGQAEGGVKGMIRRADQHLYLAKHNGRNQVITDPD